jgi:hypothetical protein
MGLKTIASAPSFAQTNVYGQRPENQDGARTAFAQE